MDPSIAAGIGGGVSSTYPDSLDSSPRSRGGESWDEPPYSSPKLRLMCSYGGRIVPRPTDKSLCYLGGDTRIVVVDRTSSLSSLSDKLSRSLLGGRPFSLKYQLPNEDLDSLISVTTDEDLENMIEEYDRIAAATASPNSAAAAGGPTRRVRLFLFPSKPDSAPSSVGSLLDDSKSETWFVDALNGAIGMGMDGLPRGHSTDSASVNCLLGLEDDSSVHSRAGPPGGGGGGGGGGAPGGGMQQPDPHLPRPDSSGKLTRQDFHSVPDPHMLDTTSSFGSASSAPSLSNLPPIRVRPDDRPPDPRYANIDDHFARMNLQSSAAVQRQEEAPKGPSAPPPAQPAPPPTASASTPPTENPRPGVFGSEDDKPEARKPPLSAAPNSKPVPMEAQMLDRPVYYLERIPTAVAAGNPIPDPKREIPDSDQTYRMQTVSAIPAPEQMHPHAHLLQQQQLQQQQQQQQQQQFIHANPHYVQVPSYYQVPHPMQQTQQFDQQIPMYYLPVRQNPQAPPPAAVPMSKLPPKTEIAPTNIYRTVAPPAQMVHMAPPLTATDQGQLYNHMGYQVMHHPHPSQTAQMANYGYEYANAIPTTAPEQLHPQLYYTQATSPPGMPAQYQTVVQDENAKQNRGS